MVKKDNFWEENLHLLGDNLKTRGICSLSLYIKKGPDSAAQKVRNSSTGFLRPKKVYDKYTLFFIRNLPQGLVIKVPYL